MCNFVTTTTNKFKKGGAIRNARSRRGAAVIFGEENRIGSQRLSGSSNVDKWWG
jgi:hypothetical protein